LGFQRIESLVTVGHHTKTVGHPESNIVVKTVSFKPSRVTSEAVEELDFHILYHPLKALSVIVIPSAETSSFLGPEIYHFPGQVGWVSESGRKTK
jgi:hypothetical protein